MATVKQKRAAQKVVENGGNVSKAMIEVGYSPATAKTPQKLTESKGWEALMKEHLSDLDLATKHEALLNSHRLDHMVFPMGPKKTETQQAVLDKLPAEMKTILDAEMTMAQTSLSDEDIEAMLAELGCKVRRIVHGQTARHVYFWSPDNKARKDALDMAYELKGRYIKPTKSLFPAGSGRAMIAWETKEQ